MSFCNLAFENRVMCDPPERLYNHDLCPRLTIYMDQTNIMGKFGYTENLNRWSDYTTLK